MIKHFLITTALITGIGFTGSAVAQDAKKLDEVLRLVQQDRQATSEEAKRREAEFLRDRNTQRQKLQQAQADLGTEERTSERLEKRYTDNELTIGQKSEQLQEKLGQLNELFGVLQQVAGDTRSQVISSPITAELDQDRSVALRELIAKTETGTNLPKIEEIENLHAILLQEMVLGGKTSRFNAPVTRGEETSTAEVVRVGMFMLVSDGDFLQYDVPAGGTQGVLRTLPKQPAGRITNTAEELQEASGGVVDFALDPLRGQLLMLQGQNPTLTERIHQGGFVGYVILSLGAIAILITIAKMIYLLMVSGAMRSQMKSATPSSDNALGRVLQVYDDNKSVDVETLELKMDEAILKETPRLESFNTFVKIISVVAPLLGLFGTVTGMIVTFQAITLFGTSDPKVMAGGISQALVTTVLGLTVAIPTVLLYSFLAGRTKALIHILEEQAAGIIAVHAERENRGA